jgi:type IV secretion system protein VirB10
MAADNQKSPRGIPVSGEVKTQERKALDLNPQGRRPTKIKKEIRLAIFVVVCVIALAFIFGVLQRGEKNNAASGLGAKESPKTIETGDAEATAETNDLEAMAQRHRQEAALKQGTREPGTAGAATADVGNDLNLPPTEIAQRGGNAVTANGAPPPLTPAEQRMMEELAEDKAARTSVLSKGGAQFQPRSDSSDSDQLSAFDKTRRDLESRIAAAGSGAGGAPGAAGSGGAGASDDQNRQIQKNDFLHSVDREQSYVAMAPRERALSQYEIKAGWDIPATLEQAMNSDLPGEVRGIVRENVYDTVTGRYLLIPQGSRVIGYYNSHVTYGQNGLQVVWTRLIYPDGSSTDLAGLNGQDVQGLSGFRDTVDNHYKRLIGFALLTSLFAAGVQLSQQGSTNNSYYPSNQQLVTQAIGQQMGEMGIQITNRNLNVQPTIKIPAGYRFTIRVRKDLIFDSPYREEPAVWK